MSEKQALSGQLPPAEPKRTLRHILELDGVRGIAALMVLFHHAFYADLTNKDWPGLTGSFVRLCAWGSSGVDLFFVLSGFLITSLLIQDRGSPRFYQDFYWKRALRILPLYFACLLIMAAVQHNVGSLVVAALFLANFSNLFHVAAAGPFWTLAIEEQFYLFWPTIVRRKNIEHIFRWALLLGGVPFVLRIVFAFSGHFNYRLSFLHSDGLAFGALLAIRRVTSPRTEAARKQERVFLWASLLLGATLVAAYTLPLHTALAHAGAWAAVLQQTGITLLAGGLIGLIIDAQGSPYLGILRSRMLLFAGLISYALYMIHDGVLYEFDQHLGIPTPGHTGFLFARAGIVLAVTVALCLLSRYALELPAMSLRKRVLAHPNPRAESENPPLPLARM